MKLAVLARVDYLHFILELPALIAEKTILTFFACWTQVSDRCPLGNLFHRLSKTISICLI